MSTKRRPIALVVLAAAAVTALVGAGGVTEAAPCTTVADRAGAGVNCVAPADDPQAGGHTCDIWVGVRFPTDNKYHGASVCD